MHTSILNLQDILNTHTKPQIVALTKTKTPTHQVHMETHPQKLQTSIQSLPIQQENKTRLRRGHTGYPF